MAEKQLFKVVENYFTEAILFEYVYETSGEYTGECYDSGIEANWDDDFEYEINPFVIDIGKLDVTNVTDEAGEWFINKNLRFAYLPVVASIPCLLALA